MEGMKLWIIFSLMFVADVTSAEEESMDERIRNIRGLPKSVSHHLNDYWNQYKVRVV